MANIYTWVIEAMECKPQEDGQSDVVITVHWRQNAANGAYNATVYGSVGLTYTAGSPFRPYTSLTQEQVVGWVQDALGSDQCEQLAMNLNQQIEAQINPPILIPPLPWKHGVA
jgi:hypothetical protein